MFLGFTIYPMDISVNKCKLLATYGSRKHSIPVPELGNLSLILLSGSARWDGRREGASCRRVTPGGRKPKPIGTKPKRNWKMNGAPCRLSACGAWPAGRRSIGTTGEPLSRLFWKRTSWLSVISVRSPERCGTILFPGTKSYWNRYDTPQGAEALNDLYRNELRLWLNLSLPSVKLQRKLRVTSKLCRRYGPLDRVLASPGVDARRAAELLALRQSLDPFEQARTIDLKLERIYALADRRLSPKPSIPSSRSVTP